LPPPWQKTLALLAKSAFCSGLGSESSNGRVSLLASSFCYHHNSRPSLTFSGLLHPLHITVALSAASALMYQIP